MVISGLPWWLTQWIICLQCRRPGFDPWVGKIPWKREWQPSIVLGDFHGQRSLAGSKESDVTEWLTVSLPFTMVISANIDQPIPCARDYARPSVNLHIKLMRWVSSLCPSYRWGNGGFKISLLKISYLGMGRGRSHLISVFCPSLQPVQGLEKPSSKDFIMRGSSPVAVTQIWLWGTKGLTPMERQGMRNLYPLKTNTKQSLFFGGVL